MTRTIALVGLCVLLAVPLGAQAPITAREASLRLGGRLDMQYQHSSVDASDDDLFVRRARVQLDLTFDDFLSAIVNTDFAGGGATLLDASATLNFSDGFRLTAGQFKGSYDLFFLTSSSDLSTLERTGAVGGYSGCTGVGSVCSYGRLTEGLLYAGRDMGLRVDGRVGGVTYQASVTNGPGIGERDENDGKSVAGRVSFAAAEDVLVSGQFAAHDYLDPSGSTAYGVAWGGDVQMGSFRDGMLVQGALMLGDNWMSLGAGDEPGQLVALQATLSYYRPIQGRRFIAVEPLARVSWADPDGDVAGDGGTLITPGVMFYLVGKTKIGLNLDYYMPRTGDAVYSLRVGTFVFF